MTSLSGMSSTDLFDLMNIKKIIRENNFKIITLQFPDHLLGCSVEVYLRLLRDGDPDVNFFIAADSTYGSSVDDVSAIHVGSDALVYFGDDLSSSGTMPVIIVPERKFMDISDCCAKLTDLFMSDSPPMSSNILVTFEPSYSHHIHTIVEHLKVSLPHNIHVSRLPSYADLDHWHFWPVGSTSSAPIESSEYIGGLLVQEHVISDESLQILYIGEKKSQIASICLRMSAARVISYAPSVHQVTVLQQGSQTKEFRERSGCMIKVEKANIIGILIGSMGLTAELIQSLQSRLQTLILAAGKKFYTFVMGRLNEAKLSNFPEVDLFCLVSSDDISVIKPGTFHVPVITPWELELGLGAREWTSTFKSEAAAVLSDGVTLEAAIVRVRERRPEAPIDSDEEDEQAGIFHHSKFAHTQRGSSSTCNESANSGENRGAIAQNGDACSRLISSSSSCCSSLKSTTGVSVVAGEATGTRGDEVVSESELKCSGSTALIKPNSERGLTVFESAASDYFIARDYQGLIPTVAEDQDISVRKGTYGIAVGYKPYERQEAQPGDISKEKGEDSDSGI